MVAVMRRARDLVCLALPCVLTGCSDDAKREPPPPAREGLTGAAPTAAPSTEPPDRTDAGEAGATSDSGQTADSTATGDAATAAFRGPCKITWSDGTLVRFKYREKGGSVYVDEDGDGKRDMCGRFRVVDGKTKSVSIDVGCEGETDVKIRPRYADDANLAQATYTTVEGDKQKKHRVTLVTMPSFAGLDPGYPLWARRKNIDMTVRDGLVRRARIEEKKGAAEAILVDFSYDAEGRIKRISEDSGNDGSVDRKFDYTYDDHGNVTRVKAESGDQKRTARIDYPCWK
jgi:hypothetical protein